MINTTNLTLIQPSILGKIKPYQNLSLIILCIILLITLTLSWFENKVLGNIVVYLIVLSCIILTIFILLSLPFLFFKRLQIATITNSFISFEMNHKLVEFNIHNLRFLLNIDEDIFKKKRKMLTLK